MASVSFQVIRNYSGADVYFTLLQQALTRRGFSAELRFYPHICEFLPYHVLRPFLNRSLHTPLVHSKAEYGWLFARDRRPLVVVLAHSVFDPLYVRSKGLIKRLYHDTKLAPSIRRSFDRADRIVTVSQFSRRSIEEKFGRRDVRVIYNGVDTELFRPAAEPSPRTDNRVRLLYVGNLIPRKGADLLPRILDRLGPNFVLEYTSGLRTRRPSGVHPRMECLGRLSHPQLAQAYQRCDIFLFPSRLEGFGYPVAEAMACGKPVVTTNYASLPELVEDGRGGFLCPMDDVDAFAERIRLLAADPELRTRMGAHNRAKIEPDFSLSQWAARYIQLYEELL